MELLTLIVVMAIFVRLMSIAGPSIPQQAFLACLSKLSEPAIVAQHRRLLWLCGATRYRYTCVYKGHRLNLRSFTPVQLPDSADIIEVTRW